MGNDLSAISDVKLKTKNKTESYLHCRVCMEWVQGNYVLEKNYPCFNASCGCREMLRPLDYPPTPHFYHCLCGHLDVRNNYFPVVLGCSNCGDLVKPTLESPQRHYFLCNCGNNWDATCYGNETEPCLRCGFEVIPRSEPPTMWHFWCMCGEKKCLLSYKQLTLDCTGKQCREKLEGKSAAPQRLYYKCRACSHYHTDCGYTDVPQPCPDCPAKIWPTPVPEFQHYLCDVCWMYFTIRSDPKEGLTCRRQDCRNRTILPSVERPPSIYLKQGHFVAPIPTDSTAQEAVCYFLCNCGAQQGDYWHEQKWNPTVPQFCKSCKFDVYPFLKPLGNRQHSGYFSCRCGTKWRSEHTYPGVTQSCRNCLESVTPLLVEPKQNRGVVV